MERRERRGLALVILVMLTITSLPYVYGALTCPPDQVFLGLIGQNGQDQAFYLGWGAKQAEHGHVLFEDKYNGYTESRLVFNLLWLLMGWSARLLHLPILVVFQIERAAFSILLLLVAYRLLRRFVPGSGRRLLALSLVAFSSGFGAFVVGLANWGSEQGIRAIPPAAWTPDLWVIESNVFLTMLWEVVLPSATALFLLALDSGYETFFLERRRAVRTGLVTLVLGSVYPYAVISVYVILGACALVRAIQGRPIRTTLRDYATVVLLALPIVLYDGYLVLANPDLTAGQALYRSPGPLAYFVGYGLLSLLALVGVRRLLRRRRRADTFVLVWLLATALEIYLPLRLVPFQMQLIVGFQVPLAIVALSGVAVLWGGARRRWLRRAPRRGLVAATAAVSLLLAASLTSAYHVQNVLVALGRRQLPEYMERETREAIAWLAAHTPDDTLVLSAPRTAPFIPVLANNRMYTGDYAAPTARFAEKERAIRWLFGREAVRTNVALEAFLKANRIDYIVLDRELEALGGERVRAQLEALPRLARVFDNGVVRIYSVRR